MAVHDKKIPRMTAYATQCVAFRKANLAPWLGLRVLLSRPVLPFI